MKCSGYVAILDLNEDLGATVVKQLGSDRAFFTTADVSDTVSIESAVTASLAWIEKTGAQLGGVIAAAGVGNPSKILDRKGEKAFDLDSFDFVLDINLRGTIDLTRQVLPHLAKVQPQGPDGERGIVVMVSSSAAFDGQPGQVAYSASKGAIASMTLPMARDLASHGIRVVTIAPSLFDSGMTALLPDKARTSLEKAMEFPVRAGKPGEFASIVRQSIENTMLNGTVLRIDGAMRMPSKM